MKKVLLLLLLCLPFTGFAFAPEEKVAITELHALLKAAPTGFAALKGEVLQTDKESGVVIYKSTHIPEVSTARHVIMTGAKAGGPGFYMIRYNLEGLSSPDQLRTTLTRFDYKTEMANMVKEGNYTSRTYDSDEGMKITELKDEKGRVIMDLRVGKDLVIMVIHSTGKE